MAGDEERELPDNLARLYELSSREKVDSMYAGETYERDGVQFVCKYAPESTASRFCIVKPLQFVEYFADFCAHFRGGNIFELGIAEGGSTALLALVTTPHKLVAIDNEPRRLLALDEFAAQRGFTDVLAAYYDVDQADRKQLRQIVADEFAGAPLDLVLDDASHELVPTRASFETLFPYLRPAGVFTIEDWYSDLALRNQIAAEFAKLTGPERERQFRENMQKMAAVPAELRDRLPLGVSLSRLAVELTLACASSSDVIAEVTMNEHWIVVRRGPAELDPETFRLESLYSDHFNYLPPLAE